MKIQKLTLEGFRGFREKTEFELHPNVNVFVGVNGSGKTSVLDAVGSLFNSEIWLNVSDLSVGSIFLSLSMLFKEMEDNEQIELCISSKKKENGEPDINNYEKLLTDVSVKDRMLPQKDEFIYYETNRSLKGLDTIPNAVSEEPFFVSNFNHLIEWYVNEENNENREKVRSNLGYQNPRLMPVRKALKRFFSKLEGNKYANLYVEIHKELNSNNYRPHLFIKKNEKQFKFNSLSDGEKMMVLLVSDIARKLTVNYEGDKPEEILNESAVVLIDEIDLHLHPAWQRDIIPALTHVFPNVQFLVTTHSPQVLSNVKKECVHIIEDFKRVAFTPSIYGADSNMILWDVFGGKKRPKHADERFREYYKTLETEDRDTALKLLKGLQESFGENRLDVQKAKTSFEFEYDEYLPEA